MEVVDIAIIGAGVVGLAVAAEASRRWPSASLVLLEKNRRWGLETSSRNSEVIHAGLYYPSDSWKTRLCVEGNRLLYDYCEKYRVRHQRLGKLIVAMGTEDEERLQDLYEHGRQVGARLQWLSGSQARVLEPAISAQAALYSPDTGIIDSEGLMRALYHQATGQGVMMVFASPVTGAEPEGEVYRLITSREEIAARTVVNSAGLQADQVAALGVGAAEKPPYRLYYCKGEYYTLRRRGLVNHLIYPLPDAISLGVHLTLDLAGNLRLGPNAYYIDEINYAQDDSFHTQFWEQACVFFPDLQPSEIAPAYTGIRPKLQGPGKGFHDFVIADEAAVGSPGWINLVGIESPGLTSSLAIARLVTDMLLPYLE